MGTGKSTLLMKHRSVSAAAVLALGMFATTLAQASTFGVQVIDDRGNPVGGASVCVGLPGNYSQFGALFTDATGQALVEVPNIPFVVTISKTRFSGTRINEPARNFNLTKQVTLAEGVPGPRCKAGSSLADSNQSSIKITNVLIDTAPGAPTVLTAQAKGEPTEYRLSATRDFGSIEWSKLEGQIALPTRLASSDQIYLQMRRYESIRNGWVEALSDVVTVYLPTL